MMAYSDGPSEPNVSFDSLPAELTLLPQWVVYRFEHTKNQAKLAKVPYTPGTTKRADTTNPRTCRTFEEAQAAYLKGGYAGIGFVLSANDPYCFIDLDDVDPSQLTDWQREIGAAFNSYTEVSPSGRGLHIITRAVLPGGGRKRNGVEIYDRDRYMTMTGHRYSGEVITEGQAPAEWLYSQLASASAATGTAQDEPQTEDDDTLLARIWADPTAETLRQQWAGNWRTLGFPSQSEADAACIFNLARYTHNQAQLSRLFRRSELGQRDKAKRTDYVEPLAAKAIASIALNITVPPELSASIGKALAPKPTQPPQAPATFYSAADLQRMDFPPVRFVVPGYIPQGVSLLVGKPKSGKSWLVLDASWAVATGGSALDEQNCDAGDVLYAALEDNPRRLKSRLDQQRPNEAWPHRLTFLHSMRSLDGGGIDDLKLWLSSVPRPKLIVIDVLNKVRPSQGRNENSYAYDYRSIAPLKALADEYGIAIVLVHHARKLEAEDDFDTVSGTLGLTGAVDTILLLKKTTNGVRLKARGRDLEEFDVALDFDADTCRWRVIGSAEDAQRSSARWAILAAMSHTPMSPIQITAACGQSHDSVRYLLGQMVKSGEIQKVGPGKYALPLLNPPHTPHTHKS